MITKKDIFSTGFCYDLFQIVDEEARYILKVSDWTFIEVIFDCQTNILKEINIIVEGQNAFIPTSITQIDDLKTLITFLKPRPS